MSLKNIRDNWLLLEWKSGDRDVFYINTVLKPVNKKLRIGNYLTVNRQGEPEKAKLIARASDRDILLSMIFKEDDVTTKQEEEDQGDFSSSGSSWKPSDDVENYQSDDSAKVKINKRTLERYKRQYTNSSKRKVLTPSNKANAVVNLTKRKQKDKRIRKNKNKNLKSQKKKTKPPKRHMQRTTRSRSQNHHVPCEKIEDTTFPAENSKEINEILQNEKVNQSDEINNETNEIKEDMNFSKEQSEETLERVNKILKNFSRLVNHLKDLRTPLIQRFSENPEKYDIRRMLTPSREPTLQEDSFNLSVNEEFNRSDDNVLITNKYSTVGVKSESPNVQVPRYDPNLEWIPIGTGTTKIHKDKFRKVNWKSYTVATRTLLIAAFPRKVLATRSLTGKRSPAFQNKPPKMGLDPRTVLDIVIEIKDRFKVKENLVRSIITTKCADEAKMLKTRNKKKNEINKKKKNNAVTTATNVIITEQQ